MFYDTFHKLCLDKGVSDSRACTDMGLSRSYAAKMKNKDGTPSMYGYGVKQVLCCKDEKQGWNAEHG